MKKTALIFSLISLVAFNSFGQSKNVSQLLKNQETRTEIFNTILKDHTLMMDFMQAMKVHKQTMMMKESSQMMENNKGGGSSNTMDMMKSNPEMMQKMMSSMMDKCEHDSVMCNKMAEMMSKHPKMMQMCMQKMKAKKMSGNMDHMKMMPTKH